MKRILPDAHTDFIFAVTAEEFGILVCLALLMLFAFIVLRGLIARAPQRGYLLPPRGDGPRAACSACRPAST